MRLNLYISILGSLIGFFSAVNANAFSLWGFGDNQDRPLPQSWKISINDNTTDSEKMFTTNEYAIIPDIKGLGFINAKHTRLFVKEAKRNEKGLVVINPDQRSVIDNAIFHISEGTPNDCNKGEIVGIISGGLLNITWTGEGKIAYQVASVSDVGSANQVCLSPGLNGNHISNTITIGPASNQHHLTITADRILPKEKDGRTDLSSGTSDIVESGGVPGFVRQLQQMKLQEQKSKHRSGRQVNR